MLGTLIKIRFQAIADSMFRSSRGKKVSAGMKVLAALLGIYVVAVFAALSYLMFAQLCEPFHLMGIDWFLFSFMILAAFCLMFIGSVFFAQSQMYEAKDNELLLCLPVPVSVILASRILTLYLMNLAYGAVVLLPGMAAYAVKVGTDAVQIVIFLLIFLLLPLLAVAVSCLAGALLSALSGRIRRKSLVITLLYVAFLALYLYGYTKLMDGMNYLAAHGDTLADALRKTFLPLYQAGAAVADKDLFCFGMTLVYILVPFAVIYALLSKSFLAIVTAQKSSAKRRYRQKTLRENSVVGALVKKEWLHFLSSPGYILNGAFGSAVLIAAAVFLAVKQEYVTMIAAMIPGAQAALPLGAVSAACTILGTVLVSAASISLEGKCLWIYQSCPVSPMQLLHSKILFHLIISLPAAVIASALCVAVIRPSLPDAVLVLLTPAVFCVFGAQLGLIINLNFPRFDFVSETAVVKNSMSSVLSLIAQAVVGLAPLGLYMLAEPVRSLGGTVILAVYLVILAAASAVMYRVLRGWGTAVLESFS